MIHFDIEGKLIPGNLVMLAYYIVKYLPEGEKIKAIKLVRQASRLNPSLWLDLKESKEVVEFVTEQQERLESLFANSYSFFER